MAVPQKQQWGRREYIQQEGNEDGQHQTKDLIPTTPWQPKVTL